MCRLDFTSCHPIRGDVATDSVRPQLLKSHSFILNESVPGWGMRRIRIGWNKNVRSAQGFDIVNKIAYNLNLTLSCGWL